MARSSLLVDFNFFFGAIGVRGSCSRPPFFSKSTQNGVSGAAKVCAQVKVGANATYNLIKALRSTRLFCSKTRHGPTMMATSRIAATGCNGEVAQ